MWQQRLIITWLYNDVILSDRGLLSRSARKKIACPGFHRRCIEYLWLFPPFRLKTKWTARVVRVELLAAQSRRLRQTYTLFVSGSVKGKRVSVVYSAVMVMLATPSNGSLPPCTTGKRCSCSHVIRPGTPAQRRLGSSICWVLCLRWQFRC